MPARHPHSIPLGGFLASTGLDLAPFLSGAKWGAIVGRPASRAAPARVRYLTQVIWGPGYRVAVEPVTGEADALSAGGDRVLGGGAAGGGAVLVRRHPPW